MKQEENQFLIEYEERLSVALLQQVTDAGYLAGELLAVEELEEKWSGSAPEYMAAAVPQLNEYPAAAVAWAAYFGIGAAVLWDTTWEKYSQTEDIYTPIASVRGFDEMDEYVTEEMLGYSLEGEEAVALETMLRALSSTALTMIRKESIEAQSVMAFYVFARTAKLFYRIGIAVGLRILGYNYHKQDLSTLN